MAKSEIYETVEAGLRCSFCHRANSINVDSATTNVYCFYVPFDQVTATHGT